MLSKIAIIDAVHQHLLQSGNQAAVGLCQAKENIAVANVTVERRGGQFYWPVDRRIIWIIPIYRNFPNFKFVFASIPGIIIHPDNVLRTSRRRRVEMTVPIRRSSHLKSKSA